MNINELILLITIIKHNINENNNIRTIMNKKINISNKKSLILNDSSCILSKFLFAANCIMRLNLSNTVFLLNKCILIHDTIMIKITWIMIINL